MEFNSAIFLFLAFPIVIALYFILGKTYKNVYLFIINILFYAFAEPIFILLLLGSLGANFGLTILMDKKRENKKISKAILIILICLNLGLLIFFKYFMFLNDLVCGILGWFGIVGESVLKIALPLGISFFTFQAISYCVDVYKGQVRCATNFIKFGVYFSFFAQITAGPIVRYKDVESQLDERKVTVDDFTYGIKRLLIGLTQKIIFANYFSKIANSIFSMPATSLGGLTAWGGYCFIRYKFILTLQVIRQWQLELQGSLGLS